MEILESVARRPFFIIIFKKKNQLPVIPILTQLHIFTRGNIHLATLLTERVQGIFSKGWYRYRVSSIGYLRLFSVKVSGIGYPIPKLKVSGIGIRYRKADSRYRLGIGYLNRYLVDNSDCFEKKYLVFEITFL